jgi:hypothetical protein
MWALDKFFDQGVLAYLGCHLCTSLVELDLLSFKLNACLATCRNGPAGPPYHVLKYRDELFRYVPPKFIKISRTTCKDFFLQVSPKEKICNCDIWRARRSFPRLTSTQPLNKCLVQKDPGLANVICWSTILLEDEEFPPVFANLLKCREDLFFEHSAI